ncbi:MAG: hypothetical protein ACI3U1_05955, partial [Peptococcaceae bacterium]
RIFSATVFFRPQIKTSLPLFQWTTDFFFLEGGFRNFTRRVLAVRKAGNSENNAPERKKMRTL